MKKMILWIILVSSAVLFVGCDEQQTPETSEFNPHNDTYYQIFVRSFADSDGDGIGDLNGITENLDYLEDFGVTALWLLPINPSPSYHGYDVTDYYGINEDYGTMDDFKNLITEAESRGIKILIDLVINHTSDQHPWYIGAQNPSSAYRDFYIWDNGNAFESFGGGMKDLNLANEEVVLEVQTIMDFYLEMGVHGFRLDAAKHFFAKPGIAGVDLKNTLFINELNRFIKEKHPDSYIVSEVFEYSDIIYPDYYIGSDSVYNFFGYKTIKDKVGLGESRALFVRNLERFYDNIREVDPYFVDAPFLTNHDLDRLASTPGFSTYDSLAKLKLASRILLTLPGSPFIYYGEELGMKGYRDYGNDGQNVPGYGVAYDEYRRTPFLWGDSEIETTWFPDAQNDATATLNEQKDDADSLYHTYRTMNHLRLDHVALRYGNDFIPYRDNDTFIQGYVRSYQDENEDQTLLIIHNLSSSDTFDLDFPFEELMYGDLTLAPYESLVVEIDTDLIEDYT
jgi:alpha-amylase